LGTTPWGCCTIWMMPGESPAPNSLHCLCDTCGLAVISQSQPWSPACLGASPMAAPPSRSSLISLSGASVGATEVWPGRSAVAFVDMPSARSVVAIQCRRPWTPTGGKPNRFATDRTERVSLSGANGHPMSSAKTSTSSFDQDSPILRRASGWRTR
jgi:hypothetical protein